jgi:nickel transport protein
MDDNYRPHLIQGGDMFNRVVFTVLLVSLIGQPVLAHETWIEKRNGEILVLRGHGGQAEPYDPANVKEAKAFDAEGQAVEVEVVRNKENARLSAKGNPAIVAVLYDSGYWVNTTDGWKQATKREAMGKYTIVESLKSKQWCKSLLATSAESSKPVGQGLEIVPQKDPASVHLGGTLPIKVLLHGKPLEGAMIATGGGHASDKRDPLKTDKNGLASVTIERSGLQMLEARHKFSIKDDPEADVLSLLSTMTFDTH